MASTPVRATLAIPLLLAGALTASAVEMRALGRTDLPSAAREGAPLELALDYVRSHLAELGLVRADVDDMIVGSWHTSSTDHVTHVYLRQRLEGIEVFDGDLAVHVLPDGSLESVQTSFVNSLALKAADRVPRLTAEAAVRAVAASVGLPAPSLGAERKTAGPARETLFSGTSLSTGDVRARLVYVRDAALCLHLAWDVTFETVRGDHWWSVRVDALDGSIVETHDWVAAADFRVFPAPTESPNLATPLPPGDGRTTVVNPEDPVASPTGWVAGSCTEGPNVRAVEDVSGSNNGTNTTCGGSPFTFAINWAQAPAAGANQDASVVNLFYWNNILHDVLHYRGFDRASGNFEGSLNRVFADGQDGLGLNTSSFSTPPEGANPRMQMYLWNAPPSPLVQVATPVVAGYAARAASWAPAPSPAPQPDRGIVLVNDGSGTSSDACETPFVNAAAVSGSIALVDRGTCSYAVKEQNVQAAGGVGMIVANTQPGGVTLAMNGAPSPAATFSSVMVSYEDGQALRALLPGATGRIELPATAPPNLDGDYDAGLISHEYGHGVSNRLVGGPATTSCLQNCEQMGEGWSDVLALIMTARPTDTATQGRGIATYVSAQLPTGPGLRLYPYSTDLAVSPYMHADLVNVSPACQVHQVGQVWAGILWDLYWAFTDRDGFSADLKQTPPVAGNVEFLQYMLDGMKRTACSPTFCDARSGILDAIQTGCSSTTVATPSADCCLAWASFARRGLGTDASCGVNTSTTDNTNGFALPPACSSCSVTASVSSVASGICAGSSVTLDARPSRVVGCSGSLLYQWYQDGVAIPGATSSTYSTPTSLPARAMPYVFDVSVTCSADATCTGRLATPVSLTVTSVSVSATATASAICSGSTATFDAMAQSVGCSGALQYQWYQDGVAIAGATSPTYMTPTTLAGRATPYAFDVAVTCPAAPGCTSRLATTLPLSVTSVLASAGASTFSICAGDVASFDASASTGVGCSGALQYQWYQNGVPIPGATAAFYDTPTSLPASSTPYAFDVQVTCPAAPGCSSRLTNTLPLTVSGVTPIVTASASAVCVGSTATFDARGSISAGCNGPIQYQWFLDGTPVTGGTGSTYTTSPGLTIGMHQIFVRTTCTTASGPCINVLAPSLTLDVASSPLVVRGLLGAKRTVDVSLSWTVEPSAEGGYHVYAADLDKRLIPSARGPVPPPGVTLAAATAAGPANTTAVDAGAVPGAPTNANLIFYQVLAVCANGTTEGPN